MSIPRQSLVKPRVRHDDVQREQLTALIRETSDDVRKRMGKSFFPSCVDLEHVVVMLVMGLACTRVDEVYAEMEHSWRSGQFSLPLKFVKFYKSDVMLSFMRAASGYSLAFVKVKTLEKERNLMLQDRRRYVESETNESNQVALIELREHVQRTIEVHQTYARSMSAAYARLVLHCSNFENQKEDERFFECIYFFVCSVVKLGVMAEYWQLIEDELSFLFRGTQFSANIKLRATTAYRDGQLSIESPSSCSSLSHSNTRPCHTSTGTRSGGSTNDSNLNAGAVSSKKMPSIPTLNMKEAAEHPKAPHTRILAFEARKTCASDFAPSVPMRHIVAEQQATKNRAVRNMELSQALRDRICTQRSEDRRHQLDAVMSPRHSITLDTLDARVTEVTVNTARSNRISMKSAYTTRSPALKHLLPTTEDRVKHALRGYEQGLLEHRNLQRMSSKNRKCADGSPLKRHACEFWRK